MPAVNSSDCMSDLYHSDRNSFRQVILAADADQKPVEDYRRLSLLGPDCAPVRYRMCARDPMVAGKLAPGRPRLISEDDLMGITKEELNLRVVVRRMAAGSMPYGWTVYQADTSAPLHTSADRFRGMEAAYKAGHAWLTDYISSRQTSTSKRRRSRWDDAKALMDDESPLPGQQMDVEPQVPGYQLEDRAPEQQRVAPVGSAEF